MVLRVCLGLWRVLFVYPCFWGFLGVCFFGGDFITAFWPGTVHFCWPLNQRTAMHSLLQPNLQHAIERVERPGGSHEGVGRKNGECCLCLPLLFCVFFLFCLVASDWLGSSLQRPPLSSRLVPWSFLVQSVSADPFSGYLVVSAKDRREESSNWPRRWAHAALTVSRGVPDHPRANTSVQERKAPEQHRNMV